MIHSAVRSVIAGLAIALVAVDAASATQSAAVLVETRQLRIEFDPRSGDMTSWRACAPDCQEPTARTVDFIGPAAGGGEAGRLIPLSGERRAAGTAADIRLEDTRDGQAVIVRAPLAADGAVLEERWEIPEEGYRVSYQANVTPGQPGGLEFATGSAFRPDPMPGFSSAYAAVRPFELLSGAYRAPDEKPATAALGESDWVGLRSRFWVLAATPSAPAEAHLPGADVVRITVGEGASLHLSFYGGPVERSALAAGGEDLTRLLYADLWGWLRALSQGLRWLMDGLYALTGNVGLAILLLSVVVKLLMSPLTALAERWQADVNRTHARLEPLLAEAKANFRGEAQHERVLAAYKSLGVSPLYTMKSLAGYLIQIPIFIAAFTMLGENFALAETPWLWVDDLSRPDAVASLPFTLPFFGSDLNLLPFIMTALTLVAAVLHGDADLTPALLASQRRRLYILAALFFVLFYTFPAGMVLYWTMNNLLHVLVSHWPLGRKTA